MGVKADSSPSALIPQPEIEREEAMQLLNNTHLQEQPARLLDELALVHGPELPEAPSLIDGVRSKLQSRIQQSVLDDHTQVMEARTKYRRSQIEAVQQGTELINSATSAERAKAEYSRLPKEARIADRELDQ